MTEYNLLTRKLFREGYSKERYPEYVRIPNGYPDPFELSEGFEYAPWFLRKMIFSTPCGLLARHQDLLTHKMGYQGIWWGPENDNAIIFCPYGAADCAHRHPDLNLNDGCGTMSFCNCHQVGQSYCYEQSVQKILDGQEAEKELRRKEFCKRLNGRVCAHHLKYDPKEKTWSQKYNPFNCAIECRQSWCTIRDVPLSVKRGHVYYDMEISRVRQEETLFLGEREVNVVKGIRFLKHPVSISICKEIVKRCRHLIEQEEQMKHHAALFADPTLEIRITNIYCASRPSRDLIKDLEDIKSGIQLVHETDKLRQREEAKSGRRRQMQLKKERKLEKEILQNGIESFPEYSAEYKHAVKWFGWERIAMLEEQRKASLEVKRLETSLADFL